MEIPERSYLLFPHNILESVTHKISGEYDLYKGVESDIIVGNSLNCVLKKIDDKCYFFIGDLYDPDNPSKNNLEVIDSICEDSNTFEHIMRNTYSIFGKWLVIEDSNEKLQIIGDACCTKSIKYHFNLPIVSDMASIVACLTEAKNVFDLKEDHKEYYEFGVNHYKKTSWWCGNATAFQGILSLLPNHIYQYFYENNNITLKRHMVSPPRPNLKYASYFDYCVKRSTTLLSGFFLSLKNRGEFALTLTGGKDSRRLFAACRSAAVNAHYFVSIHGNKNEKSKDIVLSQNLTQKLGVEFNVYHTETKTNIVKQISEYFPEVNADIFAQYNYAGNFYTIPKKSKIILGSNIAMLIKYYHNRILFLSGRGLADIARQVNSSFATKHYQSWLDDILREELPEGYSILDLFAWEHRAGRWAAQTINVTDLFQDAVSGFNCQEFFDINMKLEPKIRKYPRKEYFKILTSYFGNEYLDVPYEKPETIIGSITSKIEELGVGLPFRQAEYLYRRVKHKIITRVHDSKI